MAAVPRGASAGAPHSNPTTCSPTSRVPPLHGGSWSQDCSKMRYQAWQPLSWIGEDFSRFQHLVQSHSFCSCVSVKSAKLLWPSQSIWNPCPNADKGYDILDREKSGQILSDFPPQTWKGRPWGPGKHWLTCFLAPRVPPALSHRSRYVMI